MSKYTGPKFKIIKRLGTILPGLVGINFNIKKIKSKNKNSFSKKTKISEYSIRLFEKQKLKFYYCITEKQLNNYAKKAMKSKSNSSFLLLILLEKRLDNIIFRAGFANTILHARQIINHGHIIVNNRKIDISSYNLKIGDIVSIKNTSKIKNYLLLNRDNISYKLPSYLININNDSIKFISNPLRTDILISLNEQSVIEYYY